MGESIFEPLDSVPDGKWTRNFVANDGQPQSRLEPCIFLYESAKRPKV